MAAYVVFSICIIYSADNKAILPRLNHPVGIYEAVLELSQAINSACPPPALLATTHQDLSKGSFPGLRALSRGTWQGLNLGRSSACQAGGLPWSHSPCPMQLLQLQEERDCCVLYEQCIIITNKYFTCFLSK